MTAARIPADHILPEPWRPTAEVGWWAMVLLVINEAALFVYFIGSYFYLGTVNRFWPPAGMERPKLGIPLGMTAALVSSSLVLYLAERWRKEGSRTAYRVGTIVTILLGVTFLALQTIEYRNKLAKFTPQTNAYASTFFTITGFHGAHVAFGILLLLWVLLRDVRGAIHPERPLAVKATSLYWHFVDGVWITILLSLYLSPRFYR